MGTGAIITMLSSWEGSTKEGEFIQSSRGGRHLQAGQVDEGFCQGVCIDWIRRVLQEGKPAFSDTRSASQTLRQATIQLTSEDKTARLNSMINLSNQLKKIWNDQICVKHQAEATLPEDVETQLKNYFEFAPAPNRIYKKERIKNFYESLDARSQSQNHLTEPGWQAFAQQLDTYHREQRAEAKEKESRRPFTHIKIIKSANRQHYGNSTAEGALQVLLQMDEFKVKTVLQLGFGLKVNGKDEGHAVAIFRPDELRYTLFDPNYGVFTYNKINGVYSALKNLFYKLDDGKKPVYGTKPNETVTGAVSYILFAHA